ncbi:MAG TPA: response regulator [Candidatus Acidoferrum sp.]|jgi:CheY-like chemotaxis protein
MSEAMAVPPMTDGISKRTPTVYFIDDSATMREVIKIAFRRESIQVITCADAASALAQFEQNPPDAVITDVIMPDQDGYSVCTQIKQHPEFGGIPVVLMSGVVNKIVADKAVAVKADELIRKPFQPQELIGRVKTLLAAKGVASAPAERAATSNVLNSLFAPTPAQKPPSPPPPSANPGPRFNENAWPRALAEAFTPKPPIYVPAAAENALQPAMPARISSAGIDTNKLRGEIARLELLVKKLQTELQIERQYNQALELHVQNLFKADS